MDVLLTLPTWLSCLIVLAVFVTINCAGVWATRGLMERWLSPDYGAHNDHTNTILSAIGVFYGLMLGLVVVGTYQIYADASTAAANEANSLAALYRDVSGYPEPKRSELQADLRMYTDYVIEEAWPMQSRGIVPEGGIEIVNRFQSNLASFEPNTNGQMALHQEALRGFNSFIQARRQRLLSVGESLPEALWILMVLGGLVTMMVSWCYVLPRRSFHYVMTSVLTGFIALMVFLAVDMSNPFRGDFSVDPGAFELIRSQLMR